MLKTTDWGKSSLIDYDSAGYRNGKYSTRRRNNPWRKRPRTGFLSFRQRHQWNNRGRSDVRRALPVNGNSAQDYCMLADCPARINSHSGSQDANMAVAGRETWPESDLWRQRVPDCTWVQFRPTACAMLNPRPNSEPTVNLQTFAKHLVCSWLDDCSFRQQARYAKPMLP